MTARLFTSALFAGLIAGLIAVLLQYSLMEPLILEGEEYETGNKSHFAGVLVLNEDGESAEQAAAREDAGEEEEDENLFKRFALAFFADFTTFVGYGFVLVAGFAIAQRFGVHVSTKDALLWGIAGYIATQMAPGIGLPPELPGTPAARLEDRQMWWIATVVATAVGLGFLAYGKSLLFAAFGVLLLVAPHVLGAPHLDWYAGVAPPELSGEYVARSLAVGMIVWMVLGLAAGYFWNRQADKP